MNPLSFEFQHLIKLKNSSGYTLSNMTNSAMKNLSAKQLFITDAAQTLIENPEALFLNLALYQVWDIKGKDSKQLVRLLASCIVEKIALFQSIDFIFTGYQYSVLRLGNEHFRLGLYGELGRYGELNFEQTIKQATIGLQVQASCNPISVLALSQIAALNLLPKIFVVPPWQDLPPNFAFWVTITENPVLIWQHQLLSHLVFELHTTLGNAKAIKVKLINIDRPPHQLGTLLD